MRRKHTLNCFKQVTLVAKTITITFTSLWMTVVIAADSEMSDENNLTEKSILQEVEDAAALYQFTEADIQFIRQFSLSNLPPLPASLSNQYADNIQAAKFGKRLFFDKRLSLNGEVACATCHQPQQYFTDGLAKSIAIGETRRSAPSIIGAAHSPWLFWDGRKDSLWSQALAPIENPEEHGLTRVQFAKMIVDWYREDYEQLFKHSLNDTRLSSIPLNASPLGDPAAVENWQSIDTDTQKFINRIFSNAGKALMAYQRQLSLPEAKFDRFVDVLMQGDSQQLSNIYAQEEVRGLRLFMGKANCASCHNGPLFTNFEFHNIGAPEVDVKTVDMGRYEGVKHLVADEFTCLSTWSDADTIQCEEMRFLKTKGPELVGAFKTPTLRNIAMTAPYMQGGQLKTLRDVINHYNVPTPPFHDPEQHPNRPHFDILPLQLSEQEINDVIHFLNTLTSPIEEADHWWHDSKSIDKTSKEFVSNQ